MSSSTASQTASSNINKTEQHDILSIQSGVMAGAVGNDAAGPIYAQTGLSAARLDTVRLAAHPGHGAMRAQVTPPDSLSALLTDFFSLPKAHNLRLIQTGYFGSATQVAAVATEVREYLLSHPQCQFLCDPVLGDGGRLYVDSAIKGGMKTHLLPLADYLTPNLFELGALIGKNIKTCDDAMSEGLAFLSAQELEQCRAILVTGVPQSDGMVSDCLITRTSQTIIHTSQSTGGISGSGDVLAALMASNLLKYHNDDIHEAVQSACALTAVLMAQAPSSLTMSVYLPHS